MEYDLFDDRVDVKRNRVNLVKISKITVTQDNFFDGKAPDGRVYTPDK